MRLTRRSWSSTFLAKLGFTRRKLSAREQRRARAERRLLFEDLERREMLAADLGASAFQPHENQLLVRYDVVQENAAAFDVAIYRTTDGQTPAELLGTQRISDTAALAVGSHELTLAPEFTGLTSGDQLLVQLDSGNEVGETDESNNQALYSGTITVGLDGRIYLGGAGAARITDNSQTGYTEAGSGWTTYSSNGAYEGSFRYHSAGTGANTATWTFESLDPAKRYQAFATWNVLSNRASNAPFTILDDATALTTVRLTQQGLPNDVTVDGRGWESLGVFQVTSGRLTIQLSDDANGFVNADAIRLVEVPPVTAAVEVIDDGDAAYAESGSNWLGQVSSGAHDGDFRYHSAGTGQNAVTWTFDVLDPTKQYQVLATWNVQSNRASNAPYTISDGTTNLATIRVTQQALPNDLELAGRAWESLGVYQTASGRLVVTLTDDANGFVNADAIRLVEVPPVTAPVEVIDDGDTAYAETGTNWLGLGNAEANQGDLRYHSAGTGQNAAFWTFAALDPTKQYQVLATWNVYSNRASNAPFTIYDDTTALATLRVNQQGAPNDATVANRAWESLGVYQASSGRLVVKLTDDANGFVNADAIRLVEVPPVSVAPTLIDDGDTAYAELGGGWLGSFSSAASQGDTRYHSAGTGANAAEWTFAALPVGQYAVYTTWTVRSNAASNAPFAVYDGATALAAVTVNQRVAPSDVTLDGLAWKSLGVFVLESGSARVRLTDQANGFVTADAVRLVCLNAAPVATELAPITVEEDAAPTTIDLTQVFADDQGVAGLTFAVVGNTNAALVQVTLDAETNQLMLSYTAESSGAAVLTLRATDAAGFATETSFTVNVTAVNDAPTTSGLSDVSVAEDAAATVVDLWSAFADVDHLDGELTYEIVANSQPSLFGSTAIDAQAGTLTLAYATNAFGAAMLTVRATDAAGQYVETSFTVNVAAVNDAPTTTGLPEVNVSEDAAPVTINLRDYFADLEDGAAGLTFSLMDNSRPDMVQPGIVRATGELILSFQPNAHGTAQLTVRASDGEELYVDAVLTINVASVNDAPVVEALLDSPDPAIQGAGLNLRAVGVTDDGAVVSVAFYRDADRDGAFNAAIDQLIGTDTDGTDGWALSVSTAGFGTGPQRYYAIATDNDSGTSSVTHTTGNIGVTAILDNTGATYGETGSGWTTVAGGLEGGARQHAAGTGQSTATWTFERLVAGAHQVYVTWTAGQDRASNATYHIYDNSTLLATVTIDQRQAPALFEDAGVWWQSLGTYQLSGGSLTVALSDQADGVVVADGVRVLDPPPHIEGLSRGSYTVTQGDLVTLSAQNVTDADNAVAAVGFYLDANGNGTLEIGTDTLLGTDTDGSNGWSCTVATAALPLGNVRYFARAVDTTELPSNVVTASGYIVMPTKIVNDDLNVDADGDGTFDYRETGPVGWTDGSQSGGYLGDYRAHAADSQQNAAIWTISGLEAGKRYAVYTTWTANTNRSANASYSIYQGETLLATEKVSQKVAPSGETLDGITWQRLGNYTLSGSQLVELVVRLVDATDGYVVADAIRIVEIPPTETTATVVDDSTAGFSRLGSGWTYYPSDTVPYDGDMNLHNAGTGQNTATWTFDNLEAGARYQVYTTWKAHTSRATAAPYTIIDSDGTPLATERVNQRVAPDQVEVVDSLGLNRWFNLLGTYTVAGGRLVVQLADDPSGPVCADAIYLVKVAPPTTAPEIVDDNDTAFSRLGDGWTVVTNDAAAYGGDLSLHAAGTGTNTAAWTFDGLESGKRYEVLVTWKAYENRATNAPYTIDFGAGAATVAVNQQANPTGDEIDGRWWQRLGVYTLTGSRLVVNLSDLADGTVCADAVRVVEVPADTTAREVIDDGDVATTAVGTWQIGQLAGGNDGDYRAHAANVDATFSWTFDALQPGQRYQVYATWVGSTSGRATNAPYEIVSVEGDQRTSLGVVHVDQRTTTAEGGYLLGTFLATSSRLVVELSAKANGYVIADAVRVVPVPQREVPLTVVDNGDADYMELGGGWQTAVDRGVGNDFRYVDGDGTGNHQALWTFDGLDPTKQYLVMATWTAYESRATNAPYEILDAATSLGTIRVDQRRDPTGRTYDGQQWQSLGIFRSASGLLQIRLSDLDVSGRLSADAIRLVEAPTSFVIENGDEGFQTSGKWEEAGPVGDKYLVHVKDSGAATATWSFDTLESNKRYDIYASWSDSTARWNKVPFQVYSGATWQGDVYVDQTLPPRTTIINGKMYQWLGTAVSNSPISLGLDVPSAANVSIDSLCLMEAQESDAPREGVYEVPGSPEQTTTIYFVWTSREARYNNLMGVFVCEADGSVGGRDPDTIGYVNYAMAASVTPQGLFSDRAAKPVQTSDGTWQWSQAIELQGGQHFSFYSFQNSGTRGSEPGEKPYCWFYFPEANVDNYGHFKVAASGSQYSLGVGTTFLLEDLSDYEEVYDNPLGYINDGDFDDVVFTMLVGGGDLDTDSDNNSAVGTPAHTDQEEALEDGNPGKLIATDRTGMHGVPLTVKLDAAMAGQQIRFVASGSTGIRIWKDAGHEQEVELDTCYDWSTFSDLVGTDGYATFYVTAATAGDAKIELQLAFTGTYKFFTADTVNFTVVDDKVGCLPCMLGTNKSPAGVLESIEYDADGVPRYTGGEGAVGNGVGQATQLAFAGNAMLVYRAGETYVYSMIYNGETFDHFALRRKPPQPGEVAVQNTLAWAGADLVETDTWQTQWVFTGSGESPGQLTGILGADGNVTERQYDPSTGRLTEERQLVATGAEPAYHIRQFSYDANGRVSWVTTSVQASPAVTTRVVQYVYYADGEAGGRAGNLKLVTVRQDSATGAILEQKFYRYYTAGEANGFAGAVKMLLSGPSVARAVAALNLAGAEDLETVADNTLKLYADEYFKYDNTTHKVVARTSQGSGCSICTTPGLSETTYSYAQSSFADGLNTWKYKCVESLADGSSVVEFSNYRGQTLLRSTEKGTDRWITWYQYDELGNVVRSANPSAVTDYSESLADLVGYAVGQSTYLRHNAGVIEVSEYYTSTTPPEYDDANPPATGGGVRGYLRRSGVQTGDDANSVVWQNEYTYVQKTVNGRTAFFTYTSSQYPKYDDPATPSHNENFDDPQTVTYHYQFFSQSAEIDGPVVAVQETILPAVSSAQHGSGQTTSTFVAYDTLGRTVWTKDAANVLSYTGYDRKTGGVSTRIDDVDTVNGAGFDATFLPAGWQTPANAGQHLVSTYASDLLGRTIKSVDATGEVTYTVYNDAAHEVRTYRGWNSTTHQPTGAVEVYREDLSGNYSESLSYTWTDTAGLPVDAAGRPTGAESLTDARVVLQSLSRSLKNGAGQLVASRQYFSLTGLSYTTARDLGAKDVNYLETQYTYDPLGRLAVTSDNAGVDRHTFFDTLSRTTKTWVGSDDVPNVDINADGTVDLRDFRKWVADNPTATTGPAGTSMYLVSASIYDAGLSGGDSNLTESRSYFGPDATDYYTTRYQYDARDRMTGVLGSDGVASIETLDNLGQTSRSQTYANCTYVAGAIVTGTLLSDSEMLYDERGQVYQSVVHNATGTATLTNSYWYDELGRLVQTLSPDGMIQQTIYNSLGQVAAEYVMSGASTYISVTEYVYDAFGRQIETRIGTSPGNTAAVSKMFYDADHGGANPNDEQYRVTGVAQLKPGSDTEFVLTTYEYDTAGRVHATISADPDGTGPASAVKTINTFDLLGRAVQTEVRKVSDNTLLARSRSVYAGDRLQQSIQDEVVAGSVGGNVTATYGYDELGRNYKVTDPLGGYQLSTFDLAGNVLTQQSYTADNTLFAVAVNVYDTAGRLTEVKQGTTLANAVTVTRYWYDADQNSATTGDDQGRVTAVDTLKASGSTSAWVSTKYGYDAFGRQNVVATPDPDGAGSLLATRTEQLYDSAGRATFTKVWTVEAMPKLLAQSENVYTGVYLTEVRQYTVDADGNPCDPEDALTTHYTYGDYGRVVKVESPTGSFTKTAYSLDGTVTAEYLGTSEGATAALTDDTIVEQTERDFDAFGNVILTTSFQRHAGDATTQGVLTAANSRVSYRAAWYDDLGRTITTADYGTNDGTAITAQPSTMPTWDANPAAAIVTAYGYDGFGRQNSTVDALGHETRTFFDSLGRVVKTVQNYIDGDPTTDARPTFGTDQDVTVEYAYNATGQLATQSALNVKVVDGTPTIFAQTTTYVYSGDLDEAHQGSPVPRSDLLRATIMPDSAQSKNAVIAILNGGTGDHDFTEYTYHANGAMATQTDQRGVTHSYVYDDLGRLAEDRISSLGNAAEHVDGSVRAITTAYNQRGLAASVTSYDSDTERGAAHVVNQVAYAYNDLNLVTQAWQAHNGPVDNDGQGTDTPSVQYAYDTLGRLTTMTHPSGRVVGYEYGAAGSMDDRLSRVTAITDGGSATYAQYTYLGANTVVGADRPAVPGGLSLSYGTAANGYDRLDKFGRVLDQVWAEIGANPDELDHYRYTYDEVGNRLTRENVVAGNLQTPVHLDEKYAYDEVYRLLGTDRGELDEYRNIQTPTFAQDWTLDGLGNWSAFNDDGTTQTRDTNTANEIESITTGGTPTSLAYDAAGNLTNDGALTYAYDAWNRQVGVNQPDADPVAAYQYDALNRRVVKQVFNPDTAQVASTTDLFFNEQWQVLEEWKDVGSDAFGGDGRISLDIKCSQHGCVVMQGDKILIGGTIYENGHERFAVARYNTDGSLDTTFGGGDGYATVGLDGQVNAIILNGNSILAAGWVSDAGVAIARFDVDGAIDTTFGGGDGLATETIGWAWSMALDASGRILIGGGVSNGIDADFLLARFTVSGTLDTTFSDDGWLSEDFGGSEDVESVLVQGDNIVLAGRTFLGSGDGIALARYTPDGDLDEENFGVLGKVVDTSSYCVDATIFNGSIYVVGGGMAHRYTPNGAPDTSFGGDGRVDLGVTGNTVVVQSDGRILIGGSSPTGEYCVGRLEANGGIDQGFGDGGLVETPITDDLDEIYALAVQADGRIVVAGLYASPAAARYTADGWLDTCEIASYTWDITYIDAPLVRFRDTDGDGLFNATGETVYFTWDANHNITALVDAAASGVVERYVYAPYGGVTVCTADFTPTTAAPTTDGPLYAGYWFDAETGNLNVRYRIYNLVTYAWAQRDPLGYAAGDANLYRYCGNMPTSAVDPSGNIWIWKNSPQSERGDACATSRYDTVLDLAMDLKLNAKEYREWLESADDKPLPVDHTSPVGLGRKFTVPNVVIQFLATNRLMSILPDLTFAVNACQTVAIDLAAQYSAKKFKVVSVTDGSSESFKSHFSDRNTYGFIFAGHGGLDKAKDGSAYGTHLYTQSSYVFGFQDMIRDDEVRRPFKLAFLRLYACWSANPTCTEPRYWSWFVSNSGTFEGGDGPVYFWTQTWAKWTGPKPPAGKVQDLPKAQAKSTATPTAAQAGISLTGSNTGLLDDDEDDLPDTPPIIILP